MDDNIKMQIEFEQKWMEDEIRKVKSNRQPRPNEPDLRKSLASGMKIFGIALLIGMFNIALSFLSADNPSIEYLFAFIGAAAITFGIFFTPYYVWSDYSSDRKACEKWQIETRDCYKQVQIEQIKRKYETRIYNLEQYGSVRCPYRNSVKNICLHCGSTNVQRVEWGSPGLKSMRIECEDCGYKELY